MLGSVHVGDPRMPIWVRKHGTSPIFALTIGHALVRKVWSEAFDGAGDFEPRTAIGVEDKVVGDLARLAKRELFRSGAGGRLYTESLAISLAVHLLRSYGTFEKAPAVRHGGLSSRVLRRVLDHIEAHLQDDLSLQELAAIAGLSVHHFANAFKGSTGISPHRYVIGRRVDRARALLQREDKSISEIAYAVGFSSQSHLTGHFLRVTGLTPRRFRQSLD